MAPVRFASPSESTGASGPRDHRSRWITPSTRLHPLAMVMAHRDLDREGPVAWQRAAQAASIVAGALRVIPLVCSRWSVTTPPLRD